VFSTSVNASFDQISDIRVHFTQSLPFYAMFLLWI